MKTLFCLLAILILGAAVEAQIADTGSITELIDVDRLMYPRDGITYQVSSYDRTGGNDDGFSGKYSFIRKEGEELVIFEEEGPGCIYRIWSANPERGRVRFYFDGETEPRIDVPHFQDLFTGGYYPFVKPIVANFLGGWNSYLPIPFKKSCKIVAQGPVFFLQITWRKFASDQGVRTFTRELSADDKAALERAVKVWSNPGEPPAPFGAGTKFLKQTIGTDAGLISLADIPGAGIVRSMKLRLKSPDLRALRKVLLRVYTDGEKSTDVWSPVGDFFMTGFDGIETHGLLIGIKNGEMYSYFPMPFEKGIKIELVNETGRKLEGSAEIAYEPVDSLTKGTLRFHAWWHRQNPTVTGQPFPILESTGQGHWCGVSHFMHGNGGLGFLEGDEMLWIDGRDNSHYNGTGTEDYFNCGWYFGSEGCQPLYGCTQHDDPGSKLHAYRIHLTDLVPFQKEAKIVIEHGPANDINADYSGVTYWYASHSTTHKFAPVAMTERLPKTVRLPKAVEAESSLVSASGNVTMVSDTNLLVSLMNGKGVVLAPVDGEGRITFNMNADDTTVYDLYAWLVKGPSGGIISAAIDGKPSGITIDTYSPDIRVEKTLVAELASLRKGEHEISFKLTGRNKRSSGQEIFIDCLRLEQGGIVEAEELKIVNASADCSVQGMELFGSAWTGNAQVWFRPVEPGKAFSLELPIEKPARYKVSAFMTKAADYGIVRFKFNGKLVGEPFDAYNNGVVRSERLNLGSFELSKGTHELTIEVTGKNEKSKGYFAGIDALVLEKIR